MVDLYPSRCEPEPRILPRLEPVVHRSYGPTVLNVAQIERFNRDGYLVLDNLFRPKEVIALQASATRILADPTTLADETVITEPGSAEVRSVFMIHRQSAIMSRLAADERLAGVARFLLNDEVYIHQSRLNYKPGFVGKEFYWHSDFETWHVEDGMPRMRALSMSILLASNSELNGPLMFMPGSHRKYLTCVGETPENHYQSSLKQQKHGVPDRDALAALAAEHGIVAATGHAGTVVLFDCNVMHGSNDNITPFPRANVFFVYNAVSNRLLASFGPEFPRPEFIASRQCTPVLGRPEVTLLEVAS